MRRSIAPLVLALVIGLAGQAAAVDHELPAELKAHLESLPDDALRIEYLEQKVAAGQKDHRVQFALGNLYFDTGRVADAVTSYEAVVAEQPESVAALVNLGSAYDELGRLDDALQTYNRALALEPNEDRTLCNIGGVYFRKRQYERAMQHFQKALEVNPKSQLAHYNLAILFADSQIYREAIAEWEKCAAIDPQSDLGSRSRDNIEIIRQMMEAEVPDLEGGKR